jgi:excisionase family DNA binding protein
MMNLDEYITITEAAQILNKTVSMIGRLCRAGKLSGAEKKGNAAWLIPRAAVESYTPGKRGPRTKKERLTGELADIRAELAATKGE